MSYVNPIQNASNAFVIIWEHLPLPIKAIFYVGLALTFIYAFYRLLSR